MNMLKNKIVTISVVSVIIFVSVFSLGFAMTEFHDIQNQMTSVNEKIEKGETIKSNTYLIRDFEIGLNNSDIIFSFKDIHVLDDLRIATTLVDGSIIVFRMNQIHLDIYMYILVVILISHLIELLLVVRFFSHKNISELSELQEAERNLSDNTLSLLSENIHHELKTPLVVISSKLRSLKEKVASNCKGCDQAADEEDFGLIETHIDVIYNILNRMKDYKNIKNNNTNKSIYEIIDVSFKTLQLFSKNDFNYSIDPKTKQYMVEDTLKNEDIISIFINHIKNSIEAHSSVIELHFIKYYNGMIYLQLMDDGKGIGEDEQDKVFGKNFSTKDSTADSRGIGLYLSKITLTSFGGDDFLITSSPNGTSFGINIPAHRRS